MLAEMVAEFRNIDTVPGRGLRGWIGEEAFAEIVRECEESEPIPYTITEAGKAYLEGRK